MLGALFNKVHCLCFSHFELKKDPMLLRHNLVEYGERDGHTSEVGRRGERSSPIMPFPFQDLANEILRFVHHQWRSRQLLIDMHNHTQSRYPHRTSRA